uniref:F-box associated domain-containing protein n=1 Tax=Glycine max TaxID=3847 RepID=A0A0R0EEQ8_SOYBN
MRPEKKPSSSLLCNEIIEEILSRLPEWNSLILEPYFIKLHLSKSTAKDDLEHLQLIKNVCLGSIPEIHMESCDVSYHLVGSCNGLHCGVSEIPEGYCVCFWNKATRVISRESPPLSFSPGIGRRTMFGFGYDPSSEKYKVVAIALTMLSLDVSEKTEMKVYGAVGGVYLSGTLNWVVIMGKETIHSEIVIVSVDLEKETCRSLFLPDDFCFFDTNIGVFRDSLCVWQDSNTHLGLWQMRKFGDDKSWIQLINYQKNRRFYHCAYDEYQTIRYNQRDGKSQVSIVPSGSFRTLLWRNLKIFTKSLVIPY